jgi:hypothetical protein
MGTAAVLPTPIREHEMTRFMKAAGLAGLLAVVLATASADVKAAQVYEGQAVTTELSPNASAVTYWVGGSDGWHVVTTVDSVFSLDGDTEQHAVVRFSSILLPGQSQLISVPAAIGEQQQVLRIRRLGNQIEVAKIAGPA